MKIVRVLDNIVDTIYRIIFIVILLLGLYYIYDTYYIFNHASASHVRVSKPGSEAAAASRPLTEDYIAWLTVEDTSIDYPIMQGDTNSEYLNKDPYGDYSLSGSIFLDSRNDSEFKDSYSLVYGHHMESNFMFGALDAFMDKEYYQAHQTGTIETKSGIIYDIEIFACIQTDANNEAIFNPQGSEVLLQSIPATQYYQNPKNKHIVALSTCLEPGSTRRTVVLATLEEREGN